MPHLHSQVHVPRSRGQTPARTPSRAATLPTEAETPEEALLQLQRTIGNQAVMRLIQRTEDEQMGRGYNVRPVAINGTTPGYGVQRIKGWFKKRWKQFKNFAGIGGGGGGGNHAPVNIIPPMQQNLGPKSMEEDQDHGIEPTDDFSEQELQIHMRAYQQARFYHATKVENADKIMENGGLDPNFRGKGGASEAQNYDRSGRDVVFLGGDHHTSLYYERQIKSGSKKDVETLRPFVGKAQSEEMGNDYLDDSNLAYVTENAIPSSQIVRGNIIDQPPEKLKQIFAIVKEYYPEKEQGISVEEIIKRHWECISKGLTTHKAYSPSGKKLGRDLRERNYQAQDDRRMSF